MAQYGRTWWGEQWLRSLDKIDFSNRLPRGRSYANTGKVSAIKINGNTIQAKVRGSRPKPYDVTLVVPPFSNTEKETLIKNIKGDPLAISQLLNRQLSPEILAIAEKNRISIFPKSWKDIKLNCSCPDWAVPCKHLAAVIYIVANEIDQNPFLVFNLHRFDLLAELTGDQLKIGDLQTEHIYSIHDCIAKGKAAGNTPVSQPEPPDFSLVENLLPVLPLLFTANPLFYDKDFKAVIHDHYKRWAKHEPEYVNHLKNRQHALSNDYRYYEYRVIASENGLLNFSATDNTGAKHTLNEGDLPALLAQTESKHLEHYSPSYVLLYLVFQFCNILAERGALLPRLFKAGEELYCIQWVPALLNASVKKVFDSLLQWHTEDMLKVHAPLSSSTKKTAKKQTVLQPAQATEALVLLCSFFSNLSAQACYANNRRAERNSSSNTRKINTLFFDNQSHIFELFSEKEIPNTIQLWLNRFYISKKDYAPLLQVNEREEGGFEIEILIKDNTAPMQPVERLLSFLKRDNARQFNALKDLQLLAHYLPGLNNTIASKGRQNLQYSTESFAAVLTGILPAIQMLGIPALLPKSLQHLLKPQVTVSLQAKGKNKQYLSLDELLDFDWRVSIGETFLTKEEFISLSQQSAGLVKIRDQYVLMSREEIEKIIKKLSEQPAPKASSLIQAALSGDYEGAPVQLSKDLKDKINELLKTGNDLLPVQLKAELRHYQQRGYHWLYKNAQLGLGSLLADDMGLGKTIQVITLLQKFKEEGRLMKKPVLIIMPTTLLSNWKSEIEKFAPSLNAVIFHGIGRKPVFKETDVVLTTYGVSRTENKLLAKQAWHALVIDEAQNIKNSETAQTKAVKKINASIKIALSGTPVENRLMEYWSIFDFVNPGYLGNANWFNAEYAKPIEQNQDKKRLEKFARITSPFIMRRLKTDKTIISDLPEKIENNQVCNLSREQAALYKSITKELMNAVEQTDGINRRGLILKLLTVLKQVCNHPLQYLKNSKEVKPEQSGKMMLLLQMLETVYENGEKVLIFSQYREMGNLLRTVIHEHFGKKALQLHGGCTRKERDEMVQSFQNNPLSDTFILSLKAGGTGLNLTAASHVIHYDLWWNPAVEAQATDRAFRIGQKRNVMVHRMITKGTLEEKIDDMLRSKKELAKLTVANGEKWIGELSDKDLRQLIALEL